MISKNIVMHHSTTSDTRIQTCITAQHDRISSFYVQFSIMGSLDYIKVVS